MGKSKESVEDLQQELLTEIGNLRKNFQQIISTYQTNIEAEMIWCINSLSENGEDMPKAAESLKELEFMLKAVKNIKLKPHKGRYKDIRRIHELMKLLSTRFSE